MTRDDLLKALAERFPDATGEESLKRETIVKGKPLFHSQELTQVIMESRNLDAFLAICQLKRDFDDDFEKLGEFLGKAATIAVYYQISKADFLKTAIRAFQGAEEYQQQLSSKDMN
jgi:hypothetical protein